MGKKSLIKSTAKKEAEKTAKKAAAKKAKKSSTQAAKKAEKKSKEPKVEKKTEAAPNSKPAPKQRTIKELTFLKFEALTPAVKKITPPKPTTAAPTAPPFITAKDADEKERQRALLSKKFDMAEIKSSAKAPMPKQVETEVPAPKVKTAEIEPVPEPPKAQAPEAPKVTAPKPAPQPAQESAYISVEPTAPAAQSDPLTRSVKIAAAAAALLVLILLAVSASNSAKYYIKPIDNSIEIWKGDFSPKDKSFFMVLHGTQAPDPLKDVYSKKEVFPLIFNYYIDKSDTLLEVKDLPDFEGIKNYLHKAEDYAVTNEMKSMVSDRLNTIERMILLYKADVALSRNTEDSLESAIKILKDAGKLTTNSIQAEEINQKMEAARAKIEALKGGTEAQSPVE